MGSVAICALSLLCQAAAGQAQVTYSVTVDTSPVSEMSGNVDVQFNPGGADALSASGRVVRGFWWRTLGVVLLANVVAALAGVLVAAPLTAIASSSDREVWALLGETTAELLTTPFVAVVSTLLWFDLRARAAGR